MPHITVEHSINILEKVSFAKIGKDIHEIFLEVSDTFKLDSLRTRLVAGDCYMGNGKDDNGFVHITVELLSGRSQDVKDNLIKSLNNYLLTTFSSSVKSMRCKLSVELREMDPANFKYA